MIYKKFSCEKTGSKEVECKSLIRPSHSRSFQSRSFNDIRENPKCTHMDGGSGEIVNMMVNSAHALIEKQKDAVEIDKLYDGKWGGMQLRVVNGKIVGADNTNLNGTCLDEKPSVMYAEVRNPMIEGKIDLV